MDRREFLLALGLAGGAAALPFDRMARAQGGAAEEGVSTESRRALHELINLLGEVDRRYLGPEWKIERAPDASDGHRFLAHLLQGALLFVFEADPERPVFQRIVSPTRKFLGDNPDAVYFTAPIRPDRRYRIRGNKAGAVYVSFTVERGAKEGRYPTGIGAVLNDTQFDVKPDGSYEVSVGGAKRPRGWLELAPDAGTISTRHYYEEEHSVAADWSKVVPLSIEPLEDPGPPKPWDDAMIAAGLRRVANFVRGATLEQPPPGSRPQPAWVSTVPNQFNPPEKPGQGIALAAADNAYSMAPYVLLPDQALVIEGRFPKCRFANVVLWNRFMQTYDYAYRRVSLNRKQTKLQSDGSFRMVVAHRDPGVPNWIDTEGRPSGTIFWRFQLPEGPIETPRAQVVPFSKVIPT